MTVKFGKKYKDSVTGFEGVATARTEYMAGCARILLESITGDSIKEYWFDETRLEGVELTKEEKGPGGPGQVAPSRNPGSRQ